MHHPAFVLQCFAKMGAYEASLDLTASLREYFIQATAANTTQLAWRMTAYERGHLYADLIERHCFAIPGKRVLDMAAGWGAHAVAFAQRGAEVVASDLYDSEFAALEHFAFQNGLRLKTTLADCVSVPLPSSSFDVILCLELIEHIPDPKQLAVEIERLLAPNGVCFLTTPAKFRSAISREPHYNLPLIAALPFFMQDFIATKIFRRSYPFPITRQYCSAKQIENDFACFAVRPILYWSVEKLAKTFPFLRPALERFFWKAMLLRKT